MSFIREHLPGLIKSDSKIDSGKLEISGTIKLEKPASSNGGGQSEELLESVWNLTHAMKSLELTVLKKYW